MRGEGEQIQGGAFQSSRSPTARHGWFCGASLGRLAGTTCLRTDSRSSISFVFCHIYGISLAFCPHRWQKKGMFERGEEEGSI